MNEPAFFFGLRRIPVAFFALSVSSRKTNKSGGKLQSGDQQVIHA